MRTPFHGSRPSGSSSGKTQRLLASRAASRVARPAARWSARFVMPPTKRTSQVPETTTSGRRRTTRVMSRRSGRPYSIALFAVVEELDGVLPDLGGAVGLLLLAQRPAWDGSIASMPASPRAHSR